jgi:hypothetical protein
LGDFGSHNFTMRRETRDFKRLQALRDISSKQGYIFRGKLEGRETSEPACRKDMPPAVGFGNTFDRHNSTFDRRHLLDVLDSR